MQEHMSMMILTARLTSASMRRVFDPVKCGVLEGVYPRPGAVADRADDGTLDRRGGGCSAFL